MLTRRVHVSDATTMSGDKFPGTGSVITTPAASCGPLFVTVMTYGRSAPNAMLLGAVIVIARSAPAPAVTVNIPVFNTVVVPKVGVTAVEPTAVPVASPGLVVLIVAKPVGTVVQVTRLVMSFSVPSLKFPTALNCCVCPTAMDAVVGVTAIDCNVGVCARSNRKHDNVVLRKTGTRRVATRAGRLETVHRRSRIRIREESAGCVRHSHRVNRVARVNRDGVDTVILQESRRSDSDLCRRIASADVGRKHERSMEGGLSRGRHSSTPREPRPGSACPSHHRSHVRLDRIQSLESW